jgi:hypothetical protein
MVGIHIADAFLRPESNQATQAEVKIYGAEGPQVSAMQGNLELTYRSGFQLIPEGETYRIYLDGPAEPQKASGGQPLQHTESATRY